jgi:predicted O-methyltransferase YrrM
VDLLFIDDFNHLYLDVLQLLETDLADGALIVADNADCPGYREYTKDNPKLVSVTIDGRVEVSEWVE